MFQAYNDESGKFILGSETTSLSVWVIIPDSEKIRFNSFYNDFISSCASTEKIDGEVKGYRLTPSSFEKIINFIEDNKGIQITPVILDTKLNDAATFNGFITNQIAEFRNSPVQDHQWTIDDKEAYENIHRMLPILENEVLPAPSHIPFAKAQMCIEGFNHAIRGVFKRYNHSSYRNDWRNGISINIDAQDVAQGITPAENYIRESLVGSVGSKLSTLGIDDKILVKLYEAGFKKKFTQQQIILIQDLI